MTIKQLGGVFGRNPTFNDVTIEGQLTFDGDIDINSDLKVNGDLEVIGSVGIGASPAQPLHVYHPTTNGVANFQSGDANVNISLMDSSTTAANYVGIGAVGNELTLIAGNGGEKVRVDSSGFVGIGNANPSYQLSVKGASESSIQILAGTNSSNSVLRFGDSNAATSGSLLYDHSADALRFNVNAGERARIDSSGNSLWGTTSTTADEGGIVARPDSNVSNIYIGHATGTADGSPYIRFRYGTGNIGSITQSGTAAVLYNTSSDQRLKDNIVDAPSASDDIDAIQVRSFDWKVDGSHQKYGMVAQELVTVAPSAVSQPEDPGEMMGVDYSKLVPMMLKEIQSLRARVAQLEGAN